MTTAETVKLSEIQSAGNVRRSTGDVRELAYSIERVGILNPLTVRRVNAANGPVPIGVRFELVAGHRRLAAAEKLGLETVPVVVLDADDTEGSRIALQLIENLQREDLAALEEADALAELVEILGSQKAAAEAIGRSQAHVSKRLKVRDLPEAARDAIDGGTLTLEDAFELSKVDTPAGQRRALTGLVDKGTRWDLDRELDRTEKDKAARKAARDVAKQKHRRNVEVVASPDVGKSWRSLEGWDGLAVDQDAHESEPCHRLVVGYASTWSTDIGETYYCADPARHEAEGESDVKVQTTSREAEDEARRQRAAAEAERREAEHQARAREAARIAGGVADRNTALKVLARFVLDHSEEPETFLAGVGAKDLPEEPEGQSWDNPDGWKAYHDALNASIDSQPVAVLYRAAVLLVLTWTTHNSQRHRRDEPIAQAVADLLGIEPFAFDPEDDD